MFTDTLKKQFLMNRKEFYSNFISFISISGMRFITVLTQRFQEGLKG